MHPTVTMSAGVGSGELFLPRSSAEVFSYVSDLSNMEVWWPEHTRYRRLRGSGDRRTVYGWTYRIGKVSIAGLTFVAVHEPPSRFAYRAVGPGFVFRMAWEFAAEAGGTRARIEARTPMLRLGFARRQFAAEVTRSLERLSQALTRSSVERPATS
jgi:hypothetical protein